MLALYIVCIVIAMLGIMPIKLYRDKLNIFGILMFVLVIVIMANCDDRYMDLANYSRTYQRIALGADFDMAEFGYYFIQKIASGIGLNFFQFRIVIISASFLFISITLKKFTHNISLFIIEYMLFFVFMDGEQLRNFLAFSIVIAAFPFLLEEGSKNIFKYILYVIAATTIHTMACVYLIFLFYRASTRIKNLCLKLIPIYLLIVIALTRYGGTLLQTILLIVAGYFNERVEEKIVNYTSTISRMGFLIPSLIFIMYFFLVRYINHNEKECTVQIYNISVEKPLTLVVHAINKNKSELYNLVECINYLGLLFLPLCMLNVVFYRLVRNICIINLIYFASRYEATIKMTSKLLIFWSSLILIIGWQIWDFVIYGDWKLFAEYYFNISF